MQIYKHGLKKDSAYNKSPHVFQFQKFCSKAHGGTTAPRQAPPTDQSENLATCCAVEIKTLEQNFMLVEKCLCQIKLTVCKQWREHQKG